MLANLKINSVVKEKMNFKKRYTIKYSSSVENEEEKFIELESPETNKKIKLISPSPQLKQTPKIIKDITYETSLEGAEKEIKSARGCNDIFI